VFAIGISLLHFLSPILKESVPMGLRKQGAKADVEKASENVSDFPILQVSLKVPAQAVVHFGGIPPHKLYDWEIWSTPLWQVSWLWAM